MSTDQKNGFALEKGGVFTKPSKPPHEMISVCYDNADLQLFYCMMYCAS